MGRMADANTVRQEVDKRAYKAYFDDQAQTSGEIVKSMADFALAERQRVWEKILEIIAVTPLPGVLNTKRARMCFSAAIRSQAATERGEPHAKS